MKTDLMKKFDKLKQEVRDNLTEINVRAQHILHSLEKLPLSSKELDHIVRLTREIIEKSQ